MNTPMSWRKSTRSVDAVWTETTTVVRVEVPRYARNNKGISWLTLLLLALSTLLTPLFVAAQTRNSVREEVRSFVSTITLRRDASLRVQEKITVRALGVEIQHGIFREFVAHDGRPPLKVRVTDAQLDGKPVPYEIKDENGSRRIYLGDPDTPLVTGDHDFALTYETPAVVTDQSGRDRLYWNVTGNSWDFPIADISARVELPEGVPQDTITVEGYTGPNGATGKNYLFDLDTPGGVTFTAGPLGKREGLILVVELPTGYIHHGWRLPLVLLDHPVLAATIMVLFLILLCSTGWLLAARAKITRLAKQHAVHSTTLK